MKMLTKLLILLAVPTAAFLTFIAQPIIGKILTPRYGGSAGTWMTTSLFFQTALLLGYAFAFWLLRKPGRPAFRIVIGLAVLAPLLTQIPPLHFETWPEVWAILTGLVLSLGPALILTTSIGILIQGWVAREEGVIPYYLYGVSNIGSVLALLAYPFWIERHIPLTTQVVALRILLFLLGLLAASLAWIHHRKQRRHTAVGEAEPASDAGHEVIPLRTLGFWTLVSFSTCTVMLGAIRLMSSELGSNPLSWVLPLGLYLLSFTVTFTGWWRPWMTTSALVLLGGAIYGYASTKGFSNSALKAWPMAWLALITGLSCLMGHALLYQTRPGKRFSLFYLVLATGGALAGLCATVIFPLLLSRTYEFFILVLVIWAAGLLRCLAREQLMPKLALLLTVSVPTMWMLYQRSVGERIPGTEIIHVRNYYGALTISDSPFVTSVSSDTTLHGIQLKGDNSREPTTYYTRESGLGIVLTELEKNPAPLRLGVIGLGAGGVAAYVRPQDEIIFWEINPLMARIARENFTYLKECPGICEVRMIDGRLGVQRDTGVFDLILVDAFSGDSIPPHLLTTDAVREYLAKLKPGGFLVVHISNRYFDLMPVLSYAAGENGWHLVSVNAEPPPATFENKHATPTVYAIFYADDRKSDIEAWITRAVKSETTQYNITQGNTIKPLHWTDERHAIVEALTD
jgi:spermidine synthase